ncbi:MAG: LysM peptidoglycan-binding domain-containing protein [Anaerolineae bacterium]|nr:LysM peptidoglycan-binding domain-containing protein [Anaerolineae bacterium]
MDQGLGQGLTHVHGRSGGCRGGCRSAYRNPPYVRRWRIGGYGNPPYIRLRRLAGTLLPILLVAGLLLTACYRPEPTAPAGTPEVGSEGSSGSDDRSAPQDAATASAKVPTVVVTPSPAYPGTYAGTPTPNPTPMGHGGGPAVETYTVQAGETLSLIASVYGCTVGEIVAANGLASADSIASGQSLRIPVAATTTGPALKLVPDSELVYGPAAIHVDLERFVSQQGGYLDSYTEQVEGELRSGAEIVQLVAQRFSVGPRVLLALMEMRSGWVTQAQPDGGTLVYPLGHVQGSQEGLFSQLSWAAARLNEGYYGWKRGDRRTVRLTNGVRVGIAPQLNPGTAAVQNCLAGLATGWDAWSAMVGPDGFASTYRALFGSPFAYTVEPLVPEDLEQPELRLPWAAGETWYYTGGPHGGWGTGSGMAALDFVPGDKMLGCAPSSAWVTAAASGRVLRSENGEVIVDLDGDGFEQTGWVLLYLHIYQEGRVEAGTYVERGERIGHPSCEGGASEATHLHLARRYNGEWIPAGSGSCPMVLSGWTAHDGRMPYDGTMTRGSEERFAREMWSDDVNGLLSDNETP